VIERRSILKAAAAFGGLSTLAVIAPAVSEAAQESEIPAAASPEVKLEDVLAGPNIKLTIERRGQIVLFGINRPYIQNGIDPGNFEKLAEAYYARVMKAALGVGREEDDTGIFTMCVEIDDGQWATGAKIPTLFQLLDNLGGNVSEQRRAEMSARYPQKR
jgi:hypothetical protein